MFNKWMLFLLLATTGLQAVAHNRSESFSEWSWRESRVSYSFSVLQREATRIPSDLQGQQQLDQLLANYLRSRIAVSQSDEASVPEACAVYAPATALPAREGYLRVEGSFRCAGSGAPVITIDTFFDLIPTHSHYAKVRSHVEVGRGQVAEFLFTQSQRSRVLAVGDKGETEVISSWQAFSQYLWIGAEHIAGGIDHLAFLFGLILLAGSCKEKAWRQMAWLITGFTLGHSLSLALAVLRLAEPNGVMVEAMIGFTIVLVVIEAVGERYGQLWRMAPGLFALTVLIALPVWFATYRWELVSGTLGAGLFALCYLRMVAMLDRRVPLRLMITSVFGLIHGFGFAGGLLETGFPAEQLAFVLVGFNLGVELGQLAILAIVLALLMICRRAMSTAWLQQGSNVTVATLGSLGTFWFVSRLLG